MTAPPPGPGHAFHGGASFAAIGTDFADLSRRHAVVDADVLDAWYEPAPAVLDTLRQDLPWLLKTSPPTHGDGLRALLARRHGLAPEQVLVGGGSSSLMFLALPRLLPQRGARVVLVEPMYGEYRHLAEQLLDAAVTSCDLRADHGFRPEPRAIAAAAAGASLLVLVNPNSPCGTMLDGDALRELLARLDPRCRVWIDETYVDFVPEVPTAEPLVRDDPRVIVAKSMSKFFALSGLRVGYLVCSRQLAAELEPWNPPWSAGLLAQVAAVRALHSYDWYRRAAADTRALRIELQRAIDAIPGLSTIDSVTNFLLVHTHEIPAARLVQRCREHGVYLRDCDSLGRRLGGRYLRTAVKDRAGNARIADALRRAMAQGS